jgi:HSP20 family protein
MITMRGERKQEKEEKNKKFHRIERSYGSFMRSFRVPDDVDENTVKAEFKDGMINVTLPKSGKSKAKSINVSIA